MENKGSHSKTVVESVDDFLAQHWKLLVVLASLTVVLAVGRVGWKAYETWTANKAAEQLYPFESKIAKIEEAKSKEEKAKSEKSESEQPQPGANSDEELLKVLGEFAKAVGADPGSRVHRQAAMRIAQKYTELGRHAEARDVLLVFASKKKPNDLTDGAYLLQLSTALAENDQCPQAIENLESVTQAKELQGFHGEAWLQRGICQQKMGQLDKAKESYETVRTRFDKSGAANKVEALLRLIKFQEGQAG